MSHFDTVTLPPQGAANIGSTPEVPVTAIADEKKKFYGVQFHPEVQHTENGSIILKNFIFRICGETSTKKNIDITQLVKNIKETIKDSQAKDPACQKPGEGILSN